ncbi:TPA: FAD-binding protein, partial [Candidatus Poribacteria bacterium]|nr:FAD-binding protein [Candidatus Poribacteria bacterium]
FYAGYPMSVETSFIGGNIATNAGGSKVIKYGNTGHHVLGLEVVLPTGEIVQFGGKRRKDSSGYNFVRLFVGSEGTLGVFTKAYLNLIPQPGRTVDLLVPFGSVQDAIYTVPKVITESKALPTSVEFMDRLSVELTTEYLGTGLPFQEKANAYLIIQFDGRSKDELADIYEKAGKICLDEGALEVFVADNPFTSEMIWRVRRNWLEGLRAFDPYSSTGDVVVPTSQIPKMMEEIKRISERYGVRIPCAAHVGDGNLHPYPMKPEGMSPERWQRIMEEILDELAMIASRLGGAPSGEHGIGFLKKNLLPRAKREEVELMRRVKGVFDPNGIMNPGKLF